MARYNFLVEGVERYSDAPPYPEETKFVYWDSYFWEQDGKEFDTMEVPDGYEGHLYTVYKPKDWNDFIEYLKSLQHDEKDEWMNVYIDLAKWCEGKDIYWGIGDGC